MKNLLKIAALVGLLITPLAYAENMPADVLARVKEATAAEYPDNFFSYLELQ